IHAAAYPDRALAGKVVQIALAPTISGQGRAYEVTVDIDVPADVELRSGMSARADIYLGDGGTKLAVPVEAVVTDTGEDDAITRHVWVARDGKGRKVKVGTGLSDDRWEEVTSGLSEGELVIVGPARALRTLHDGAAVTDDRKPGKDGAGEGDEAEDA